MSSYIPNPNELVDNSSDNMNYSSYETGYLQPLRVTKIPNRNDLCPCGSGKKFKKCCIHKTIKEYYE